MATIRTGPTISKIAGGSGSKVYSSWKGRGYIRQKSSNRANASSSRQATARAGISALSKKWYSDLTAPQRSLWDAFAQRNKTPLDPASSREPGSMVVIPQPKPVLSGYDAFIRCNQRAVLSGARSLTNPARTPGLDFPNPVTGLGAAYVDPRTPNFALNFDGVNEDVTCGNVLDYEYTQPFSWEFWLNADVLFTGLRFLINQHPTNFGGYQISYLDNDFLFEIRSSVGFGVLSVRRDFTTIGSWKHAVFTYDGSNTIGGLKIYVDSVVGQFAHINFPLTASIVTDANLTFSSWAGIGGTFYDGRLDCIRTFAKELNQIEVDLLYNGGAGVYGLPIGPSGIIPGCWPCCAGSGNTLVDISGNNYHGTLRNMEPGDWVPGHVPCPPLPSGYLVTWTEPPGLPVGSKVRIWVMSSDAGVHKQHVATEDIGIGFFELTTVRVAQGRSVPILSMPGHYLIQADIVTSEGNISGPSNTIELVIP